jgi:hypothetical protein
VIVAVIGASAVVLAAVITARLGNKHQLSEIHVLVNARLTEALGEIDMLKAEVKQLKKEK